MIRNRNQFPPGGWQYVQQGTGWSVPPNLSIQEAARRLILHRQNHPELKASLDLPTVADEIDIYTCNRLAWDPQWCNQKKTPEPRPAQSLDGQRNPDSTVHNHQVRGGVVQRAVGVAKQIIHGSATLFDWLGEGGQPVSHPLAEYRASVCTKCPLNKKQWTLRATVAAAIRRTLEVKQQLSLKLNSESGLGTCSACECSLPLKVWVPLAHILNHTPDDVMRSFHKDCWITAEKKS